MQLGEKGQGTSKALPDCLAKFADKAAGYTEKVIPLLNKFTRMYRGNQVQVSHLLQVYWWQVALLHVIIYRPLGKDGKTMAFIILVIQKFEWMSMNF